MRNPTLTDLIGGIQSVTLSDEEARRRGTQKSILERKAPPTFGVMVELISRDEVAVHKDVAATVDAILRGYAPRTEIRQRAGDGQITISAASPPRPGRPGTGSGRDDGRRAIVDISTRQPARSQPRTEPAGEPGPVAEQGTTEEWEADGDGASTQPVPTLPHGRGTEGKPLRVYPFGVSRNRLEQAIDHLAVPAVVVRDQREADLVMTLKNYFRRKPQPLREAEARGMPVYVLRANTGVQMENVLTGLFPDSARRHVQQPRSLDRQSPLDSPLEPLAARPNGDHMLRAMAEVEDAITSVLDGGPTVSLTPQAPHVRRLQHEMAERFNVASRSRGKGPQRRVEIFRPGVQ